jgi:alpha-mannosidase
MKIFLIFIILFISSVLLFSQPLKRQEPYDISKDRVLYVIGYAHLDTEWNWDYPASINEYIKNIMTENFHLFEKYPEYVFNFTGSRRYQMMKEYYPDLYKKLVQYVKERRWYVSGSSVDEAEVNISSPESIIRQVLYGNEFFKKEFGVESKDIMLPDCFGFLASLPTIWNYCGMLGFSTAKLYWHSAAGIPFNVGVWNGPDGKGVIAALAPTSYVSDIPPRFDKDSSWNARISDDIDKYGISFDYRYYGIGDQGGAPLERDVKNAVESLHNSDGKFKVLLTSSDQMYKDITPELRKKLPVYSGDLLLIEHSAGSLTSEAYMKRINRKNELLAGDAEELASAADWMGGANYPHEKLNNAWNLVLGSQFHDILPGTAIPKAYEYAWNDEFIAANGFAEVLKNSAGSLSSALNTQTEGRTLVVYNPVAMDREDVVTAELTYSKVPENIKVFDNDCKALPSQIIDRIKDAIKFIFLTKVPSVGLVVFDVRETKEKLSTDRNLVITNRSLENDYYKVKIDDNGDILSIYDKKISKELLSQPARLEFLHEHPKQWPAWNMDWDDRQKPPIGYMNENASISIVEEGPVRIALQINREGQNSKITQLLSLAAGDAGKCLEVGNKIDWQSRGVSLKASFPLTVSNENATYNLGVGTIERATNNPLKYEVPSREWVDLTDKSGNYGVSILEDCKFGSDKPNNSTVRLTLLYTPIADAFENHFIYQDSQDWGIHDFRYGIYGHNGDWRKEESQWQGKFFNQPLMAFETSKHNGQFGKDISLLRLSSSEIGLMAFKKMEDNDHYVVRINELKGNDNRGLSVTFPNKIVDAYEVNGQEQKINGPVEFSGNTLKFDIGHYTIRSFAVKFETSDKQLSLPEQTSVTLPYNQDVFSFDDNRSDGNLRDINLWRMYSYPAELLPPEIISEDIHFKTGSTADEDNNVVECMNQVIQLPRGDYNKLYILAAAIRDTSGEFIIDGKEYPLSVQHYTGYVGQFYNRQFTKDMSDVVSIEEPFTKRDDIAWFASHGHIGYPSKNDAYHYCYIYKYEIDLPKNAQTVTLPDNKMIKIFAMTIAKSKNKDVKSLQPLYDNFSDNQSFILRH